MKGADHPQTTGSLPGFDPDPRADFLKTLVNSALRGAIVLGLLAVGWCLLLWDSVLISMGSPRIFIPFTFSAICVGGLFGSLLGGIIRSGTKSRRWRIIRTGLLTFLGAGAG